MKSQYLYNAMAVAFYDLEHSDPIYKEFLVVETSENTLRGHFTIVSRSHFHNIKWIGKQPEILYSTLEGSYSRLL